MGGDYPYIDHPDKKNCHNNVKKRAKGVEKNQGMEVPDHVFFLHPPEKQADQKPGYCKDHPADLHAGFFAHVVYRGDRDVANFKVVDI